ncbi:MAG TPA: TonB-dependent receptor, partial [Geobacteraceae bacterium]|nr:TonB-dependent receptor [Geobacteraceae bacterium]
TAKEIEMMGAHTLSDVLTNIPGINIDDRGSVGTYSSITIQGSGTTHILVMIDGVMQNFLFSSDPDISSIPVQQIERIEIIKGPGSSSWGSSLGGVVNIVTKSPREDRKVGGTLSASIGEATTRDVRGELSGTLDRFGYYLYAGHLASDGLSRYSEVELNSLYSKFRLDLPHQGSLTLTVGCATDRRQDGEVVSLDSAINDQHRYLFSTLAFNYPLNDRLDLDLSLRGLLNRNNSLVNSIANSANVWYRNSLDEDSYGGSAKLTWRQGIQSLAVGLDFDHADVKAWSEPPDFSEDPLKIRSDKWGVFLNDIIYFKGANLTVTPGVRYDRMNPVGDFTSPSLGVAWNPTGKITLRAYGAHGYSLPILLPGYSQEKVWTVQSGFETTLIPYIWFKGTYFSNWLSDVDDLGTIEDQRKQGVEVEGKTVPVFNTSLSFGYTFIDAENRDTGETLKDTPRHLLKLGVHYDDRSSLRAALLGRYVDWNATPENNGRYSAVIWDLNLAKRFRTFHGTEMELFFNVHNLFNGSQYDDGELKNARRWVEGGIKFDF